MNRTSKRHNVRSSLSMTMRESRFFPQTTGLVILLMVIAKAGREGRELPFKIEWHKSFGIIELRGIKTSFPLYIPLITFVLDDLIHKLYTVSPRSIVEVDWCFSTRWRVNPLGISSRFSLHPFGENQSAESGPKRRSPYQIKNVRSCSHLSIERTEQHNIIEF